MQGSHRTSQILPQGASRFETRTCDNHSTPMPPTDLQNGVPWRVYQIAGQDKSYYTIPYHPYL